MLRIRARLEEVLIGKKNKTKKPEQLTTYYLSFKEKGQIP